jgi:hypothetical protein
MTNADAIEENEEPARPVVAMVAVVCAKNQEKKSNKMGIDMNGKCKVRNVYISIYMYILYIIKDR